MLWLHIIQYSGFVLAQISNAALVWLILTKAEKLFGTYRHVMCTFAVYSLVYAWVEVITQPVFTVAHLLCAFLSLPLNSFTDTWPCAGKNWKIITKKILKKVAFIAPMYWSIGKNGEKIWKIIDCIGSAGCVCIIAVCFSTIVICASAIYLTMKSATCHMSARTLELNRQLFMTLTFQTLLPFMMMYSPVGLLITLPLFEVYVASLANIVPATLAVYPSLEPLIAMFCIKEFRRTLTCSTRKISPMHTTYLTSSSAIL